MNVIRKVNKRVTEANNEWTILKACYPTGSQLTAVAIVADQAYLYHLSFIEDFRQASPVGVHYNTNIAFRWVV